MDDFKTEDTPALYESLKEKLSVPTPISAKPEELAEKLSIASYYLYRNTPPGIWLKCKEITSPKKIDKAIKQKLSSGSCQIK